MSNKKQRRLPKIGEKREKREDGSDVNPNKKVHAGDVHDLLTSHMSKPVAHGCTLPEIGNGLLMKQQTGNIMNAGSGEQVSTHLPQLPAAQQQVNKLSKRSSASRHGFEELPLLPAVVKQDCGNKEGSHLKRGRLMPVHLPLIENMTQSSSGSSWPTTEQNNLCKLPDIKNAQVKRSRPMSGNLHRLPHVLPPIFERKEGNDKNLKLPQLQTSRGLRVPERTKQRKRIK